MKIATLNRPTMSSREIAELTGKEHRNVLRDARAMLVELHGAGGLLSFEQTYQDPQNGQTYPMLALPRRECLILVSGYNRTLRTRIIDRWEELEAHVAQPAATPPAMPASVEAVMFAEAVNRALRLEGSAALGMIRKATELTAPHLLPMLPAYAIDAPPSELATRGSSRPTASMLTILRSEFAGWPYKKPDTRMVASVYAVLQQAGILEQRTRPSTSSPTGVTQFWSITDKGLEFGKNITSERNQRETAPHWYTDTAGKLLDLVISTATPNT